MRSLMKLATVARTAVRNQAAIRPISVCATQMKASSAIPLDTTEMADADHHSKGYKVQSNFDRWLMCKFHSKEYANKEAVPQYVDYHDYHQATDMFRMWATTLILMASFTVCGALVLIYNPLQPHHDIDEVDSRRRQNERVEAYQAFAKK